MTDGSQPRASNPSLPLEDLLVRATDGVVRAQRVLDQHSMATAVRIQKEELDRKLGLTSKWFTIPELELSLRVALEISDDGQVKTHLVDAEYQSKYSFELQASTVLKSRIVATPPSDTLEISIRTEEEVLSILGPLQAFVKAYHRSDTPTLSTRYLPFSQQGYAGGVWFTQLIDSTLDGDLVLRVFAVVDDRTGEIERLWTDAPVEVPGKASGEPWTANEALAALAALNRMSEEDLRTELGVSDELQQAIEDERPFDDLQAFAALDFVDVKILTRLYEFLSRE